MANLAIKGHATRGKEVIEILEMLGGVNQHVILDTHENLLYSIRDYDNYIIGTYPSNTFKVFTLEEFLEKFPYKVGDKVQHKDATSCGSVFEIEKMRCVNNDVEYIVKRLWHTNCQTTCAAKDLQPYKEEIVGTCCCSMPTKPPMYKLNIAKQKDTNKVIFDTNSQCCDISNKIIEKETMEKEISGAIVDRFICLEGYDFYDDKGNIIDTKEITMKKKLPQYPNTYEECCELLFPKSVALGKVLTSGYNCELLKKFGELLVCRDAYWKIVGDWEPEFRFGKKKYCIMTKDNKVISATVEETNRILVFPTEEMRDAFYENFKKLIEECKELL